ncbi:hypothetical protein D9599_03495 [Roseomonas sp. KE2513]|uniref:phage head spike fiber domain-containing protein n=1 Tax=Roseomonas sp. KE2513 TaxID=2479202 RepID=UPI0018E05FB5|nr:hypothetical protein [Roseomonas sp. KE2513]MBI0534634.1 hypothetical protein [Roseomonas sp. KE2513]
MIGATPIIHALGGGPLRLVSAGALSGGLALTRASTALAADTDGTTMLSFAANAPRFQGAAQRLLVEGGRTNSLRNPRLEGAVAGSPGTPPTYWTIAALAGTTSTLALGTDPTYGLPVLSVRVQGTPTATGYFTVTPEVTSAAAMPASIGQTWTFSAWVRLAAGSLPASSNYRIRIQERGGGATPASDVQFTPAGAWQRITVTRTITDATTTYIQLGIMPNLAVSVAADFTLQIMTPQAEQSGFASTPVLPAAGTPASSTRGADVPVFSLNAARAAAGSLVGTFMLPTVSTGAADVQGLLVLDDGTDGNRFGLRKPGGAATLQPFRSASGTLTSGSSIQTLAPGVAFRAALAWDTSGIVACCNGGTVMSLAGAIPSVNRLLVGHGASTLGQGAFGEVGPLDLHPTRLPDATLQALTLN